MRLHSVVSTVGAAAVITLCGLVMAVRGAAQSPPLPPSPGSDGDWPLHNRDLYNARYSPLADINAANARGRTAMHGAAGIGADSVIQFLAEKGANLDAKDRQGNTPLTVAAGKVPRGDGANRIYEDTVKLLLKLGAQPLPQTPANAGGAVSENLDQD